MKEKYGIDESVIQGMLDNAQKRGKPEPGENPWKQVNNRPNRD